MNENRSTTSNENNNTADQSNVNNHRETDHELTNVNCRPGLKLPKTPTQWNEANLFFHHAFFDILNTNAVIGDLNEYVVSVQNKVYDYFASTCGVIEEKSQSHLYDKYGNLSVNAMKSKLKKLKAQNANLEEIKFLSNLIRKTIKNAEIDPKSTENNLHKSFWKTCRDIFNRATNSLPTFSVLRLH